MRNRFRTLNKSQSLGLVLILIAMSSERLYAASVQTTITATILSPIAISKQQDLSFGEVYPDVALAGTVTVDFSGGRSFAGGAAAGSLSGSAGAFTVTGESGAFYVLTIPATVNLTGPGSDMPVALTNNASGTLNSGSDSFNIGGVLNVGANQGAGAYSATFDVIVNYN